MGAAGWGWAPYVLAALGQPAAKPDGMAMRLWKRLPEWEEAAPRPPPSAFPVPAAEARTRLATLLGATAEQRPAQADYASAAAAAFNPRAAEGAPHLVLAEAGTGTGKTLGYLAPASLWAEHNQGAVWVSTYTRHLQRQIESEASRLGKSTEQRQLPGKPTEQRQRVVLRKGRENYLCLLNYEDAANFERHAIPLGLIARWATASADGDLMGGDLPGWFAELFGHGLLASIADRRGECIHAACPHYKRCVIEHVIRRARLADLVIANHALVMAQAVWGGLDDDDVPTRYVFDEGHHIFDAADSAFCRRTVRRRYGRTAPLAAGRRRHPLARPRPGPPAGRHPGHRRSSAPAAGGGADRRPRFAGPIIRRPLRSRAGHPEAPQHPAEAFLRALRQQARARASTADLAGTMPIEVDLYPIEDNAVATGATLSRAMQRLRLPLTALRARFLDRLETEAETLEETTRQRLEGAARSLKRRAIDPLTAWQRMLDGLGAAPRSPANAPATSTCCGWTATAPVPIATSPSSATCSTRPRPSSKPWLLRRTACWSPPPPCGTVPRPGWTRRKPSSPGKVLRPAPAPNTWPPRRSAPPSPQPFDYAAQTRACVVTDVGIARSASSPAPSAPCSWPSGGGGLGLFTAISRLRAVHARIAAPLEAAGIPLLAQHVDAMDNATLVDIFRAEIDSCLLGTDAMRDGVDVPGRALRLVVFERTPWPRPDILHRDPPHPSLQRRAQGLRRRHRPPAPAPGLRPPRSAAATDKGVFVLLDRQVPTRVLTAFPAPTAIIRCGLAEACTGIQRFLRPNL